MRVFRAGGTRSHRAACRQETGATVAPNSGAALVRRHGIGTLRRSIRMTRGVAGRAATNLAEGYRQHATRSNRNEPGTHAQRQVRMANSIASPSGLHVARCASRGPRCLVPGSERKVAS